MKKENTKQEEQINYDNYAYRPDSKVVISGATFMMVNALLDNLRNKEVKVYFPFDEKTGRFSKTPQGMATEQGMMLEEALDMFFMEHVKNVESGVAVTKEELSKPNVEIDTKV